MPCHGCVRAVHGRRKGGPCGAYSVYSSTTRLHISSFSITTFGSPVASSFGLRSIRASGRFWLRNIYLVFFGLNYQKFGGQKNTTSQRLLRNIQEVVFLRKNTTSKKKSFTHMPSCINHVIGNRCKQSATLWATMHVSLFLTLNMHFAVEKNEASPSHLPASSPMCHVGLLQLHAITAKGWHSPTGSRMQQVLSSLDVLVHGHGRSGHTAYFPPRRARR